MSFVVRRNFLTKTLADQTIKDHGYEEGDYEVLHVDSFGSNTAQGGYETLCAEEAALKELKVKHPDAQSVAFCSDQGSGYKCIDYHYSWIARYSTMGWSKCETSSFQRIRGGEAL